MLGKLREIIGSWSHLPFASCHGNCRETQSCTGIVAVLLKQKTHILQRQKLAQVPARRVQFQLCCCLLLSQDRWNLAAQPVDFPQPFYWGNNPSVVIQNLLTKCFDPSNFLSPHLDGIERCLAFICLTVLFLQIGLLNLGSIENPVLAPLTRTSLYSLKDCWVNGHLCSIFFPLIFKANKTPRKYCEAACDITDAGTHSVLSSSL